MAARCLSRASRALHRRAQKRGCVPDEEDTAVTPRIEGHEQPDQKGDSALLSSRRAD